MLYYNKTCSTTIHIVLLRFVPGSNTVTNILSMCRNRCKTIFGTRLCNNGGGRTTRFTSSRVFKVNFVGFDWGFESGFDALASHPQWVLCRLFLFRVRLFERDIWRPVVLVCPFLLGGLWVKPFLANAWKQEIWVVDRGILLWDLGSRVLVQYCLHLLLLWVCRLLRHLLAQPVLRRPAHCSYCYPALLFEERAWIYLFVSL